MICMPSVAYHYTSSRLCEYQIDTCLVECEIAILVHAHCAVMKRTIVP